MEFNGLNLCQPPTPIMEEVTGGNITASYSASLKRSDWDLGQLAEVRKCKVGTERVHPLPSSSQTDLQLGCELWGEEASLFLWVRLHPQSTSRYSMALAGFSIRFINVSIL